MTKGEGCGAGMGQRAECRMWAHLSAEVKAKHVAKVVGEDVVALELVELDVERHVANQHIDVRVRPVRVVDKIGGKDGAVRWLVLCHDVGKLTECGAE